MIRHVKRQIDLIKRRFFSILGFEVHMHAQPCVCTLDDTNTCFSIDLENRILLNSIKELNTKIKEKC